MMNKPNLVFIFPDQQRHDMLATMEERLLTHLDEGNFRQFEESGGLLF
ncbi:MAG: hypothetical protein JRI34_08320 [Deltaproteobacteria bacterium]|nr:hypothetical protein [Deltaproteobacteria bacterium]